MKRFVIKILNTIASMCSLVCAWLKLTACTIQWKTRFYTHIVRNSWWNSSPMSKAADISGTYILLILKKLIILNFPLMSLAAYTWEKLQIWLVQYKWAYKLCWVAYLFVDDGFRPFKIIFPQSFLSSLHLSGYILKVDFFTEEKVIWKNRRTICNVSFAKPELLFSSTCSNNVSWMKKRAEE